MKLTPDKPISTLMLALLITGSIDSIRNLPATALFGSNLLFFFVLAAILFLIPTAFVSAELSATWTEKSGIFHWVRKAFGEKWGFIAIWLQWINTLVWYPTILSFIAGTAIYLYDPSLAQNKNYLLPMIIGIFWFLTLLNLRGVRTSAEFASVCTVIGMIIPMIVIIGLGAFWILSGKPSQLHLQTNNLIPHLHQSESWISLTAIITAFLGMELATVLVQQVKDPQRTFPRALMISVILILTTMLFGALAIAIVLPPHQINLVNGVMQAFVSFLNSYHLVWLSPVIAGMLVIGGMGQLINWIISPAKGLLQAAEFGYLPHFLCYENKHNIPTRVLLLQAVIVSLLCSSFILMPSINGSYWLLTDLSTELYLLMYVMMFFAALRLRKIFSIKNRLFKIICFAGIIGCLITLIVGFIPPQEIDVGGFQHFEFIFVIGLLLMILPAIVIILLKRIK